MAAVRRPTQADVARLAGVSTATVSYVASGRPNRTGGASPEVTARVTAAMSELGYRPLWAGRALRRQRTGLLAVVSYSPLNPWAEVLLDQVQRIAGTHHLNVAMLRYTHVDTLPPIVELLRKGWADGVLVLGLEDLPATYQEALAGLPLPILASANTGPTGVSLIRQDEEGAMRQALASLREGGATRLLFVGDVGSPENMGGARLEWLTRARAGLWDEVELHGVYGPRPDPDALAGVVRSVRKGHGPSGVLCGSDRTAIAVLWACTAAGVRIPDDVRLIGMGNIDEGRYSSPPLTTLGMVDADYGAAIEHLVARTDDADLPPDVFDCPWELIVRGTA